jgi:hypothetical protein
MRRTLQASLIAALLFSPAGCASRPAGVEAAETPAAAIRRDIISREEMNKTQWANAYDLVRNLRPQWLRVRGRDTINGEPGEIQVVLDDVRLGATDVLRTIPVSGIAYLQWVEGISASQRWGTGFGNGAILVSTRPR